MPGAARFVSFDGHPFCRSRCGSRYSQGAEDVKHRGVGRDMQIEVDEAVQQKRGASQQGGKGDGGVPFEFPTP